MNKLLLLICTFLFSFNISNYKCKTVDEIIAVVNNLVILKSELENLKKLINLDNSLKQDYMNDSKLCNILLDRLIIDKMSYQIALEKNIIISDSDINTFIEKIASQNSMSKNLFLKKINSKNININYYKDFIKRKITNDILYDKEIKKFIKISEEEISNMDSNIDTNKILDLFTSYNFYEIFIPFNDKSVLNIKINNKSLINNLLFMLKNNYSINKINKFINLYNKNIKIKNYKDIKFKNLNNEYSSYFDKISKKSVLGPISLNNKVFLIKVNDIYKPDFNKILNEVNISNIFIKDDNFSKSSVELKDKINYIHKNIKENKISFSEAAKKYSDDISSNNGGNIGWNIINIYSNDYINEIKKLKIGEISDPFFSNKGWNLIKLIDSKNTKFDVFIKRKYIYEYILNKKFYKSLDEWIKKNKKLTYIKIYKN